VDYDHIESMDVELVNQHISDVIAMKEVNTPVYNMKVRPSL
jgi:uridine kinase